ncbi:MAG: MarR family transcriptional regulator [Methanosarcina sp.]
MYIYCCDNLTVLQEKRGSETIDFACKEFKVEDVIKCALNLTKADLKVMKFFLNETEEWVDTDALSRILKLDISTVQRSVKKLHEKQILQRSQQNLDGGGYVFRYKIYSRAKIKDIIMTVVNSWADRLGQELEKWESGENTRA